MADTIKMMSEKKEPHGMACPCIGDLVLYNNEYGIVCHLDPPIMICVEFHSYVAIQKGVVKVIIRSANPQCTIKPEIVERIRAYLTTQRRSETNETHSQCNDKKSQ